MQEAENLPLMPKSALVYYLDEKQSPISYQKVASIRVSRSGGRKSCVVAHCNFWQRA